MIIGTAGVLLLGLILVYNTLVRYLNNVKKTFSSIDIQLKRRADLIPNILNSVKGYMEHEKGVLTALTEARTSILRGSSNQNVSEMAKGENMLSEALKSMFAVAENYPDLKASQNFLDLQEALEETEDQIAAARRIYNESVNTLNTKTEVFPSNIVASMFGFKKENLFEGAPQDRKNLTIEF